LIDTSTINQNIAIQGISGAILGSGKNYSIGIMTENITNYLLRTDSTFKNQYNTYTKTSIPIGTMIPTPVPATNTHYAPATNDRFAVVQNPIAYSTLSDLVTGFQQSSHYNSLDYTIHLNSNSIQGAAPGTMLLLVFKRPGLQYLRYFVNWGNNPSALSVIQAGQGPIPTPNPVV